MSQCSDELSCVIGCEEYGEYCDMEICCRDCGFEWTFDTNEQKWYDGMGFTYPKICTACKAVKKGMKGKGGGKGKGKGGKGKGGGKGKHYDDIRIVCVDCECGFMWLARDQAFFATQSPPFPQPVRCKGCKQERTDYFRSRQA